MLTTRTCELCSIEFEAGSARARYCSPAHRSKAYRDRRRTFGQAEDQPAEGVTDESSQTVEGSSVESALAAKLVEIDRAGSAVGQALLTVAKRIDSIGAGGTADTGAALSSLVMRLSVELDKLDQRSIAAVGTVPDEVAKARERRDRKRNSG